METIITRDRSVEIPTNVEELTPKQYEYYCFLAFALLSNAITPEYFRIRWLSYLIGLKKADYTLLKPEYVKELDNRLSVVDGFFKGGSICNKLDFHTANNMLPEYQGYKGPGPLLQGITFGEFVECYTIAESFTCCSMQEFEEGKNQIARVLYHIPESDTVPELLCFHAVEFFGNVLSIIHKGPIEINGKKIDFRIIFKSHGKSRPDDKTGWTGITFEIATAGLFGNVREVYSTDMWEVLIYMYKCKFEYINELKQQQNNTPNK